MRTVPVAGWVMVIAAPTTTAPLESETVPRMPVSKDCDHSVIKLRVLTADAVNRKEAHRFMGPPLCFVRFQGRTDLLCYGQVFYTTGNGMGRPSARRASRLRRLDEAMTALRLRMMDCTGSTASSEADEF